MKTKALSLAIMLFLVGCGGSSTQSSDDKSPVSKDPIVQEKNPISRECKVKAEEIGKFSFNKDKWKESDYASYEAFFIDGKNKDDIYCKAGLGRLYMIQKNKNHELIYNLIKPAADKGYAVAQYNLGVMYYYGKYVTKDLAKAYEYFKKAADQGDTGGQNNLGYMYKNGIHVTKDLAKAYEYYKKAADQGNAAAINNLGFMYYNGDHVTKDMAKACKMWDSVKDKNELEQSNFNKFCTK